MRATTIFYVHRTENALWLNNNNKKKKSYEITTKSLKPSLKNLNSKDNEVVQMFIKKKTKMPVLLNNNNKQSTKK
jgi:fructose-bisphosphate aldolase class 1